MKLKWKNIRTFLLLAAVILGASTAFIYLSVTGPTPSEAGKTGLRPPSPRMADLGQEASLEQAQACVPFKIRLPTKIGKFVELRLKLPPQTDTETVYIVYAAHKSSDDATVNDVVDQNGIILMEAINRMTLQDSVKNILDGINSVNTNSPGNYVQQVSINGYVGSAGGNVGHCVVWYTETTYYRLEASVNYPLQQLVEIAQSIPVN